MKDKKPTKFEKQIANILGTVIPDIDDDEELITFTIGLIKKIEKHYWQELRKSDLEETINKLMR